MGNNYSAEYIDRRRNTIEIIMADDGNDMKLDDRIIDINPYKSINNNNRNNNKNSSCDSLTSIISITSATQTEPDLFTVWPMKQRFMFKWLNKVKYYQYLLSRSQQILNYPLKSIYPDKSCQVRMISLSTQTINKITDDSNFIKPNLFIHNLLNVASNHTQIYDSNEFIKKSSDELTETIEKVSEHEIFIEPDQIVAKDQLKQCDNEIESITVTGKHSPSIKRPRLMSNDSLISQLTNNFYNNEVKSTSNQTKPKSSLNLHSNASLSSSSTDSLTCVTVLSKLDKSNLLFKSNPKSNRTIISKKHTRNFKRNLPYTNINDVVKLGIQQLDKSGHKTKLTHPHKSKLKSKINFNTDECKTELSLTENKQNTKAPIIKYKFWISASKKNWEIFHNFEDRRIESIGRISQCKIELTNTVSRQSNGILKQKVIIYAPNSSALEKCCKLFDDKFPEFYATSRLIKTIYIRKGSSGTFNVASEFRRFSRLDRNGKIKSRKRKVNRNNCTNKVVNCSNDLGFLKYAFENS